MRIAKMFTRFFAAGLVLAALGCQADTRAGVDFDYLPKVMPVEQPGKIEVIEFFWYGCPHCYNLEPGVQAWKKSLPADVVLRREHVMWDGRSDMAGHAKIFNALKASKQVETLTPQVFSAVQRERIELRDEKTLFDWVGKQAGANRAQFEAAYKGFGAQAQLTRAMQLTRDYGIDGVPTFIVNGKYKTSPSKVGDERRFFQVLNELIAKERAAKK